jgi:hypothetical protein
MIRNSPWKKAQHMNKWHLLFLVGILGFFEGAAAAATGTIAATPNPCSVQAGAKTCTIYITWTTQGAKHARVYVVDQHKKGKEEQEFSTMTSCQGQRCKAPWVEKGATYVFTLYDYSSGSRGSALDSVTVNGN